MIFYEIKGIGDLSKRLLKVLPDDVRKGIAKVVREEAKRVLDQARAEAPVDTGVLRDSLRIRTFRKGLTARVGVWDKKAATTQEKNNYRGHIARFQEFGTKPHNIPPRGAKAKAWNAIGFFESHYGYIKKGARRGLFKYTEHPGSHKHQGWFLGKTEQQRQAFIQKMSLTFLEILQKHNREMKG